MAEFENSRWADSEFAKMYRDQADIYMPFRRRFVEATKSLYSFIFNNRPDIRVLDLGCGDGFFTQELMKSFSPLVVTLSDGSGDMIQSARKRLNDRPGINYIRASFQEIFTSDILKGNYDFINSSFAIHHLQLPDKKLLYSKCYSLLNPEGCLVHNDVIAPLSSKVESWYLRLWREWIEQFPDKEASAGMEVIPEKYKGNPDDFPDTLEIHLDLLRETGFTDVDCYFKYGIFALFGGFKYLEKEYKK